MKRLALAALAAAAFPLVGQRPAGLPLPEAPVVVVIPNPAAFDRALSGGFRKALTGTLSPADPAAAAWRRTRVGGKLESQWDLFAKDLPIAWKEISALEPSEVGLSLLAVGELEAVLAIRTPLADLPLKLPAGAVHAWRGVPYHVVSRGAGDDRTAARRIGLAWARSKGVLLVATSERALGLALDRSLADQEVGPFLPGLVSLRLDLEALRKDLYFRREFLFDEGVAGPEKGTIVAALRIEGNDLVEVREGTGETRGAAAAWSTEGRAVAAAGWETDASRLFSALRRGFLEPVPNPPAKPVAPLRPLPDALSAGGDRYAVDLTKPEANDGAPGGEGELPRWAGHLKTPAVDGWGWEIGKDGERRIVLQRPASLDGAFAALAVETETRRAGRAAASGTAIDVGPGLPAIAWKRTGEWLWIGRNTAALHDVPEPGLPAGTGRLVTWSRLDLLEVRKEEARWRRAEGAFSPERTRPFSDRILGLLGWAPNTTSIAVERRRGGDAGRWTERVVLSGRPEPRGPQKGR